MRAAHVFIATAAAMMGPVAIAASSESQSPAVSLSEAQKQAEALVSKIKSSFADELERRTVKMRKRGQTPSCTPDTIVYRREYGTLSRQEKLEYINAVKCLQSLPPRTPAHVSSGAKSRFDDFVVTHIQQTMTIHYSGNFMPWHRWFVWSYETALRQECNYTGYQPYWDWARYSEAPQDSPIFDGSDTSLGGNGEYIPHDGPVISPPPGVGGGDIQLPAGVGGGFVTTGAFANMTVNLGPVGGLLGVEPGPDGGLGYNPRRLKRDLGGAMNMRYANWTTMNDLLSAPDFDAYRHRSEGIPYTVEIGPHGGIHYTIGGDPGGDLFTSPGDPSFWVHHSQMDRMWTYWQALDPRKRKCEIKAGNYGHITWANEPPSRATRLSDVIDMGYAAPSITIGEVMDTMSGPLCYFYL